MASSIITGLLCIGIASVLFLASETMVGTESVVKQRSVASEIAGDISESLSHAISFTTRTDKAFTITVPDQNGDQMPDKIAYSWSGVAGDPLMFSFNGGPETEVSGGVQNFNMEYRAIFMRGLKPPPTSGAALLMVVANSALLTTNESERKSLIESWGYDVTVIDDGDTQDNFTAAFIENDVVYVSSSADETSLANKLSSANIGVVSENGNIVDALGFSGGNTTTINKRSVSIVANHYITQEFSVNSSIDILTSSKTLQVLNENASGASQVLANAKQLLFTKYNAILTLDPGNDLAGGGQAVGRRVHLPWGQVALTDFTGEGVSLLKRAIEWGAGAGEDSPRNDLLMVVEDVDDLTNSEQAQKQLFQDWNYKVALIAESESQAAFDVAASKSEVVYVPANISENQLGTKLRLAPVGVVNASNELHDEFGVADGDNGSKNNQNSIDIIERRHYVTFPFQTGPLEIFVDPDSISKLNGNTGNSTTLATILGSNNASLATLEMGQEMQGPDSDFAPARRVSLPWAANANFDFDNLNTDGRFLLQRSLEWAAGAEVEIPTALFVVRTAGNLNGDENDCLAILESLGYVVSTISDHDSQAKFDTELANVDVVYISETVDSNLLAGKLNATSVGVVNANREMIVDLGFSNGETDDDAAQIHIANNTHFITEEFPVGHITLFDGEETVKYLAGTKAPGLQSLATHTETANQSPLAVINAGDELYGGGMAAGRRVSLPWGDGFSWDKLEPNGRTLLSRSLRWATGEGDGGTPDNAGNRLGYDSVFATEQSGVADQQIAMQITATESAMFTTINGYFFKNKKVRYAIYTDEDGEPGNLLAESEVLGGGHGPEWRPMDLPPVSLPAGTYWLAFALEHHTQKYYYEADATQQVRIKNHDAVGDGFLTSWGTSDASLTRRITLYGTYTTQ